MNLVTVIFLRCSRTLVVIFLAIVGSTLLIRFSPGYLTDAREMDSHFAGAARRELIQESARSRSIAQLLISELSGYAHGDLGQSRQYEVPVRDLLKPRLTVTGSLMLRSICLGWGLALVAALATSRAQKPSVLWQLPSTLILSVPTAALVTLCLLADHGGPILVMTLLLAARDLKFMSSLLRKVRREQHLLQARAQGIRQGRLLVAYLWPSVRPELLALATLSFVTGLSALVPVEVLFSVPGVGQLAWNAALNRDLPVLLAVTVIMAGAVTMAGMLSKNHHPMESA